MNPLIAPERTALAAVERIRTDFPALDRLHAGRQVAYFDGPGGTQVPRQVVAAMTDYLIGHNANTHWNYPTSAETDAMIDAARVAVADLMNGESGEIAFGSNMTTMAFQIARALGRNWGRGDEVVVTELDHHANIAPWTALARERDVTVSWVRMRPADGTLDMDDLRRRITGATRLVAVGAASNALGTINDVATIAAMAREAGALILVDAVHYAAHAVIDVRAWGADIVVCSPYKFYGPHGGVAWVRAGLVGSLDVPKLDPAPDTGGERLETGTQNHEGIAGTLAAIDFIASLGEGGTRRERLVTAMDGLHARGDRLLARMWNGLSEVQGVTLFGPRPGSQRTPTAAFIIDGIPSGEAARLLAAEGLFLSHGDFYATTVIERIGQMPEGVIRAGCACYTTEQEVDRLLTAVHRLSRSRR
ncbi:MAG: cysteine desulfurase-like protein [Gemmatimonadota bacterium]